MRMEIKKLCEIEVGERVTVHEIQTEAGLRRRLQDLGMIEDTPVECIGKSPGGGLGAYLVRDTVIAIRAKDADGILVATIQKGRRNDDTQG